jgi:hypothetical protein
MGLFALVCEPALSDTPNAPRLSTRTLAADAADEFLSLDRGLPWTLAQLLRHPGPAIRGYIERRDPRMTKPLRLVIIVLAVIAVVYHLTGFADGFQAGFRRVDMSNETDLRQTAPLLAMAAFLRHLDMVALACWVPAVAAAVQRRYPNPGLNHAEAAVFGMYTLTLAALWTQFAILLIELLGRTDVTLMLLALTWPIAHAAYGYFKPEYPSYWRAISCALLALVCLVVMLLGALMGLVLWYLVLGNPA